MDETFFPKLMVIGLLLYATSLHELAHAYVATWCGDPTPGRFGRLTFNPIPHLNPPLTAIILPLIAYMSGHGLFILAQTPVNPTRFRRPLRDGALVALAGPVMNFLFAGVALGILRIPGVWQADDFGRPENVASFVLSKVALWNLILGVFNLLPLPPLDGYSIVRTALPLRLRMQTDAFARSGAMSLVLALIVGSMMMEWLSGPIYEVFYRLMPGY